MAMTMDQSTVNIFDLGNDVTASVRTNAFAALDIDIFIKEPTKTADIGGLIGDYFLICSRIKLLMVLLVDVIYDKILLCSTWNIESYLNTF